MTAVETAKLYLRGLPLVLSGLWIVFKPWRKLDEAAFRKMILLVMPAPGLVRLVRHAELSMMRRLFGWSDLET
jgi:hypothetical protein